MALEKQPFSEKMKLFDIAIQMKKSGLADSFIVNAVQIALEFEGVADLMKFWIEEEDEKERSEIISDIEEMIEACSR